MSDTTITFSGMSTYASDFQTVINRAVSIASLPITQLTTVKTNLADQVSEYDVLDADVTTLSTAIAAVSTAIGAGSYNATVGNSTYLTATATTGALEASYTVDVTNVGAYAQYMSTSASDLANNVTAQTYTLNTTVDGVTTPHTVDCTGSTLSDLVTAINSSGAPVKASIVNMGTSSARLSLQSTTQADMTMSLTGASGTDVLSQTSEGSATTYVVNGDTANPVSSSSSTVQLAPGLSVTMLAAGTTTVTVSRNSSSLATALASVATAYNTVMTELDKNRGSAGGALAGSSQIYTIEGDLRQLMTFQSGSGDVGSLVNLGLSFDKDGVASFDTSSLSSVSFTDISSFMGDGTTSGFLSNATTLLDSLNGTTSGVITDTVQSLTTQISDTSDEIDAQQSRVDLLQTSLLAQMSTADSAIYTLQQQATYYTNLFAAMKQDSANLTDS